MGIRVYVTGRVAVEVDGQVVINERRFRGKQDRLLFVYLVCERSRPVAKDELASVLWPENQSDAWEAAISAFTSHLAGMLSSEGLEELGMSFSRQYGQYQLRLPCDAWIDIGAGNSALDRAGAAVRNGEVRNALGPAAVAASIAQSGRFLAGEFARQVGPSVGQSLGLLGRDAIRDWRAANRFGVGFGRHQVGPLPGKDPPVPNAGLRCKRKQG